MSTYSVGQGITYTEKLSNLQSVLNVLPDNTQKLIAPRDVRDSIFTTWENIIYKLTTSPGTGEYIGIDQTSVKNKVYFGKKISFGEYVMTQKLLSEEVDYFFYNTRLDTEDLTTKIVLLSGSAGGLYYENNLMGTFLHQKSLPTGWANFELRNTSYVLNGSDRIGGDINLISDKGNISLNSFVFPKISQNNDLNNNGKFLKFVWDEFSGQGFATWSSPNAVPVTEIISAGTVSIIGSPVLINGRNVNFTSVVPIPEAIGGIEAGTTFNDEPVTEVLRKLLYPYSPPSITVSFQYPFFESGDTSITQRVDYSILRPGTFSITSIVPFPSGGTIPTSPSSIPQNVVVTNSYVPTFLGDDSLNLNTTQSNKTITRSLTITDPKPTSISATASFQVVLPWLYGTSTTLTILTAGLNGIVGNQTPQSNKLTALLRSTPVSGDIIILSLTTIGLSNNQGCIYFGYPSSYPDLVEIRDDNDFDVTTSFTKFTVSGINSSQSRWNNRTYKFYIYTQISGGSPSLTTVPNFSQFKLIF
jgi:hypothetical protein